jgi:hypothetical protein
MPSLTIRSDYPIKFDAGDTLLVQSGSTLKYGYGPGDQSVGTYAVPSTVTFGRGTWVSSTGTTQALLVEGESSTGAGGAVSSSGTIEAFGFGVTGDGSNQTTQMTDAVLAASAAGKLLMLPPGDIALDDLGIFTGAVKVQGVKGRTRLFVNSRTSADVVPGTANGCTMWRITGSKAAGDLLTADAAARALTITVGTVAAAKYAEGDHCILRSTRLFNGTNKAAKDGELVRVRSVDTGLGTVTFRGYIDRAYATADNAILEKVTMLEGVFMKDLIIKGDGIAFSTTLEQLPIFLTYCKGALIENVTMDHIDGRCITFRSCIDSDVVNPKFYSITNQGENSVANQKRYGYGVDLSEATRDCKVWSPYMRGGRHVVTCNAYGLTGTTPSEGVPAYNKVFNGIATEMTSAGFDWHIEGWYNEFHNCTTHDSQAQGFQLRCEGAAAYNCRAYNVEAIGFVVGDGVYPPPNVILDNPVVHGVKAFTDFQSGSSNVTQKGQGMRICGVDTVINNPEVTDCDDCAIQLDVGTTGLRVNGRAYFRRLGLSTTVGAGYGYRIMGVKTVYGNKLGIVDGDSCELLVGLTTGGQTYDNVVDDLVIGSTINAQGTFPSGGVLAPVRPRAGRQNLTMVDDFLDISTTGRIGQTGWTKGGGAGSGIAAIAVPDVNHPGIVQLSTGATSGIAAYLALAADTTKGVVLGTATFDFEAVFRSSADANTIIRVGLMTDPSTTLTSGAYLEKLAADTNWFYVVRNASTDTRVDTGASATGAAAWARVNIKKYTTLHVGMSLNGLVDEILVTNRPTAALIPCFYVANATTANKTLDVDYARLALGGLAR